MELRDVIVTPIVIFLVYAVAYFIRPKVTDEITRVYYFPALTIRIFGALALGLLYQFHYGGGDTFNYHTLGSRHIWNAFLEDPSLGIQLLLGDKNGVGLYKYSSQIYFIDDKSSFFLIRIATIFDLFTFSSYAATAVLFSVISFIGSWMLYLAFYKGYPHLHKRIALATLFIPSVVFWGSALMKDTITVACIGIATFVIRDIFSKEGRVTFFKILLLLFSFYVVFSIKKYVLLCYLPAAFLWTYIGYLSRFRSLVFKIIMIPFVFGGAALCGYLAIVQVGKDDERYSLQQLGKTAQITAYDIAYQSGKDAGSMYSLGELDGTFMGLLQLAPQAINVSLFRPYLWEVKNPLMLLSAIESFLLLIVTVFLVISSGRFLRKGLINVDVLFCFVYSVTFAFAVGVSTYNFGTLSRYKIPLLPFYVLGLVLLNDYVNKERKLTAFDRFE